MDKIYLNSIKEKVSIGVYPWEKEIKQTLVLDIGIGLTTPASPQLTLADSVNYAELIQCIRELVTQQHFELIENLASAISELIVREFKCPWVKVVVHKPQLMANVGSATIEIERSIETANNSV